MKLLFPLAFFACLFSTSCKKDDKADEPIVVSASGSIESEINRFRTLLGEPLNVSPDATAGRREVNWDGVPENLISSDLPLDFFNPVGAAAPAGRQRGLAYSASGGRFRVSNTGFADLNADAAKQFRPFSGDKVFANISGNLWEVSFNVPGKQLDAGVRGFGAVFSDVDVEQSTSLEFFNGTESLGRFFVPASAGTENLSFLGVYFGSNQKITRVAFQHNGNLSDGTADVSDGGSSDHVVVDDFLYTEPLPQ